MSNLKEIQKRFNASEWYEGFRLNSDDIEWLMERIRELEELVSTKNDFIRDYKLINQRYKQALEKIAYNQHNVEPKRVIVKLQSKAREALGGNNDE